MMGSEELGDRKQVNHTPTIALGIAGVLMLIVGAMSYMDYVERKYKKEYSEKEREMMERAGYVPVGNTPYVHSSQIAQQQQPVTQPKQAVTPATTPQVTAAQNPVSTPQQAAPAVEDPGLAAVDPNRFPSENNLPLPNDPELEAMKNSLNQVKRQAAETANRYNEIAGAPSAQPRDSAQAAPGAPAAAPEDDLPDFLRNATASPPGGNPEIMERLERLKRQVRVAPSLGKVISYDTEWAIVVFDAGRANGVKEKERFAVRRGDDILGWVKVDQVEETQSVATLVTKNRDSDTDLKPEAGDDLIAFELY